VPAADKAKMTANEGLGANVTDSAQWVIVAELIRLSIALQW
jgi:hypothetical protein